VKREYKKSIFRYNTFFPSFLQAGIYFVTKLLFKIFTNFSIHGLKNLRGIKSPIIFAVNHSSEWDGPLVRVGLPFFSKKFTPMFYVTKPLGTFNKDKVRHSFYNSKLFSILLGAYPTHYGTKDYEVALEHHIHLLENGQNICIFPEGLITKNGMLQKGKLGTAFLAWRISCPVVPVSIKNVWKIGLNGLLKEKRNVSIHFGAPLYLNKKDIPSKKEQEIFVNDIMKQISCF
jgi:1-acyl-sn-glycerol-3-phosphate acyltransferase